METKRIYPATQLIVALDPKVLKVYLWILSWSAKGSIKYYPKQFVKACRFEEEEIERCIQTLEDIKLIDIALVDNEWMITPNGEQNQKYYEIPISKVLEGNGIAMAEKVAWNKVDTNTKSNDDVDDMSEAEMKRMLLMLQARLKEKQEVKKVVVSPAANDVDDLPF